MTLRGFCIAVCCTIALTTVAKAEVTANELLKILDTSDDAAKLVYLANIKGLLNGLVWANTELTEARKQRALYCPTQNMSLNEDQAIEILRKAVRGGPQFGEAPYGLSLLKALQANFPCRK